MSALSKLGLVCLLQYYQLLKEREHILFSFFLSSPNSKHPTIQFIKLNRIRGSNWNRTEQIQIDLDKFFNPHYFPRNKEQFYFMTNILFSCSWAHQPEGLSLLRPNTTSAFIHDQKHSVPFFLLQISLVTLIDICNQGNSWLIAKCANIYKACRGSLSW